METKYQRVHEFIIVFEKSLSRWKIIREENDYPENSSNLVKIEHLSCLLFVNSISKYSKSLWREVLGGQSHPINAERMIGLENFHFANLIKIMKLGKKNQLILKSLGETLRRRHITGTRLNPSKSTK